MRSPSSTCEGRPAAMRPATYLTSGEYATTRRSRARSSPSSLQRRQSSLSSTAFTLVSIAPFLASYVSPARRCPEPLSCPGMGVCVGLAQPTGFHAGVDLRRRGARVAQELLDGAQIGPALE